MALEFNEVHARRDVSRLRAMVKRLIQTYKAPKDWVNSPPGLGDFVRGITHLIERVHGSNIELRIDVSQTEFANLIIQNPDIFQTGDPAHIATAEEYFVDHWKLEERLLAFSKSEESELYICTNLGDWNRIKLPSIARDFTSHFYNFDKVVVDKLISQLPVSHYEVLSLRCGDSFYGQSSDDLNFTLDSFLYKIIEEQIIPNTRAPLIITSDSYSVKLALASRYGFLLLPHQSQHGAFGNVMPVAMDMCMLRDSRFNYHINSWATWWSGFSHYTSLIFEIPSMNFRAPKFFKEEITTFGDFV